MTEPASASNGICNDNAIRVLVVDDHQVFAESLARAIGAEPGMKVCGVAADRVGAARAAARHHPDVVLLDFALGDDDGPQTISAIRSAFAEARVVVLTGFTDAATYHRSMNAGCAAVLAKTDALVEVIAAVRACHAGRIVVSPTLDPNRSREGGVRVELTGRELDVIQLLAAGRSTRDIAEELFLSPHTVRNYIQHAIEKLGAHSKLEAVASAMRLGLISSRASAPVQMTTSGPPDRSDATASVVQPAVARI